MTCQRCGQQMQKARKYCSRPCRDAAASRKVGTECSSCATYFLVSPSHAGKVKFCSAECRTTGQTTLVGCEECGGSFRIKPYRTGTARFCSVACKASNMDFGITPELERLRRSAEYRLWRTAVFVRDDYTCQFCRQRGGYLEADHIKTFAHHPDLRFNVDNGRTLCQGCHRKTPTFGGRSRRLAFVKGY